MDPELLIIENFMCHRYTEIDCTKFQSALIMGQSKSDPRESNGIGKTTIFHAIEYALFGTYVTDVVDDVVRDGTDMCVVTFEFSIDNDVYRVERSRRLKKTSDVSLFKNGADISQKTPTATNEELQKIIKINVNSFKNSVQFSQKNIDGLVGNSSTKSGSATPDDRRTILSEALNLNVYKKFEKIAKDKASHFSKKVDELQAVIKSIGSPKEDISELNKKLDDAKKELKDKQVEQSNLESSINSIKDQISDLQKLGSSDVAILRDKLSEVKNNKIKLIRQINDLQMSIDDNNKKLISAEKSLLEKENELFSLENKSDDLRGQKRRPLDKVREKLQEASQSELEHKATIASLESQVNDLKLPIPDGQECPVCLREMNHDAKENCKAKKQERIDDLLNEIAKSKSKLKRASNKKDRLQSEIEDINRSLSLISSLDSKIENKRSEIENDKDYIKRLKGFSNEYELESLKKNLEDLNDREAKLIESIDDASTDEVDIKITSLKNKLSNLESNVRPLVNEISQCNTNIGIFSGKIESRTSDLEKLKEKNKELSEIKYQYSLYKRSRKAFSSGGIPSLIINTILDDLQVEANSWLSELKPSLELQFTPDMDLIYRISGRDKTFSQISGGQAMLFALALKLGLSIIIQRRLGVDIKILQLDEVDQSLDKAALDAYAEAIRKLQKRFKVLVITHNDSLKDKFTDVILVEGDNVNGATSKLIEL